MLLLLWVSIAVCRAGDVEAAAKEGGMSLERARAAYEPLVASGALREVPASGIAAHRLAGFVDDVPLCVELTYASGGGVRVVRRTRLVSPMPPGVSLGFSLLQRQSRPSEGTDVGKRFAAAFSVKKNEWGAFLSSGIDRTAMAAVLAFLDDHGGTLTIGPEVVNWQAGGLDAPGQGESLARAFARVVASLQGALQRGPLAGQVRRSVDPAYVAMRAAAPEPVLYLSEQELVRLFVALLVLGLAALAGSHLLSPWKGPNFLLVLAVFLLIPGVAGSVVLALHLSSTRPALLP